MAEGWQAGIVNEVVGLEPPTAEKRCNERSDETTDIDKYIENLEAGVALPLGLCESLRTFLGCLSLEIVIKLSYHRLEIALEETVTEGNQEECEAGERQEPRGIHRSGSDRNGEANVSQGHNDETGLDSTFVVSGSVCDDTSYETEHVDTAIEE